MTRYRTKPFEIEATQWWKAGDHPAVHSTAAGDHVVGAQGNARVNPGDWIITEPNGEGFYPCNPQVFEAKYEPT